MFVSKSLIQHLLRSPSGNFCELGHNASSNLHHRQIPKIFGKYSSQADKGENVKKNVTKQPKKDTGKEEGNTVGVVIPRERNVSDHSTSQAEECCGGKEGSILENKEHLLKRGFSEQKVFRF